MRMKFTPWLLVSGLMFAGPALAADPAIAQDAGTGSSAMKVAIDPVTGKRRNVTAAESIALDAQTRELAKERVQAKSGGRSARPLGRPALPATIEDSMAQARSAYGITGFKPTADMLSSTQATRNADGTLTIEHFDVSHPASPAVDAAEELPLE